MKTTPNDDFVLNFGFKFSDWNTTLQNWGNSRNNSLIGSHLILFDEIDSTNTYLKSKASELPNGTIVISRIQTRGKGQLKRSWKSEIGGLYLSIKIELNRNQTNFPFWVIGSLSIAICEYLRSIDLNSFIKWPNDILIGSKKIAGILTENMFFLDKTITVVGIGININNSVDEIISKFSSQNTDTITSIEKEVKIELNTSLIVTDLLSHISDSLEVQVSNKIPFNPEFLKTKWKKLHNMMNSRVNVNFKRIRAQKTGIIVDITNNGNLILELSSGIREEMNSNEVEITKI